MSVKRSSVRGPGSGYSHSITRSSAAPAYRAASTYGGAGGQGTRISSVSYSGVRSGMGGMGMGGSGGSMSSSIQVSASGDTAHIMGNEKFAMQNLNDRLASYLEMVRNLEQANGKLELKIREAMEKRGPDVNDYSRYNAILDDLRKKVFDATTDNARMCLQIDNARLAADDFRVKFESELSIRQSVEADIVGLRKVIDDTNMGRMNLESEIEALKEELIFLKKNHDNEVMEMHNMISQSGVQVDVDAPKGQDLAAIMAEVRAKYEKEALKNQEELKAWHETRITEVQSVVSQNTEALQGAHTEISDLRRQLQTLEIELDSQKSLKGSLEGTLRDTEMRYNMEMESLNKILVGLESELTNLRSNIQQQTQEYEHLLNIKMKLEAEIATYRRLLDGGDFKLQDALEDQRTVKTKVMTVTQTLVDGKVVSSSTETKERDLALPDFSFLEKLHAVEEELAVGPVCLEPYQPPMADGLMACRTRSKRPLRDVPMGQLEAELCAPDITPDMYGCGSAPEDLEWTHWLQGIMTSDMYNDEEGDDDDDPEYNFLAEIDEPDVEDYRNDRAVRIPKKEVNQLMEELFETFQDELTAQEQDEEGHEEEREEEAPALGKPTFSTPPDIPLGDPMAEVTAGRYRTVKEQLAAIRHHRALLESQGLLAPRALVTKPREPPPPFTPTLSHCQRLQLQQQVQQHVQLLTQVQMLTSPVATLQSEAATTKQFLMELQMFAQRGELTRGQVEPGFTSVFKACNLQGALSLLEELSLSPIPYQEAPNEPRTSRRVRKHPSMPPQLAWLFATRPVFLYPELLPHVSLDPALHSARSVSMFTAGEDCLIVLGLRNLGETLQPKELLCHYLLRAKKVSQLRDHILEKCKPTHANNVIKAYRLQKVVQPMPVACERVNPGDLRPSVERDERAMPGWLGRSLPYIYEAIEDLNSSPDAETMSACQSKKAPLNTLLFSSSRTLDYSFPPATRYPPQLPDSLSFQRCGFRRCHPPPDCDLSLSLAVSHSATHSLKSGTTRSENNLQTGAVIQQGMTHHELQPIHPATSKPPSLQHPTKPHLKHPLRPQPKPSQKPLQVILNLPAPVAAAVLCPAHSARVLASRLSHSAPLAKDLVAGKFSTLANLRRLPRLLPAPPPNNKNPPQTNLNTVTPNSGANLLWFSHMNSRTASSSTETQTSVSTTIPIEQFKDKSSRTSRRVTKELKSSLKSEGQPQPSASPEPPALDQALTPDDCVTVVMEEEGGDEEKEDCGREEEDGDDFGMTLLALSESSAGPPRSVDCIDSMEVQAITLTLSPRPSGMGDGGREGDEGRGDRHREVEEAVSPASEVSTLSVPELQETMEKLSRLASGGRSEDSEEGERSGTPSGCCSSTPNPPSSKHEQHHTGEVASEGMSKSPPILYGDDDVLDSDPLREKKEIAFAQNYLNRVCHALQEVPGRVEDFLEVLYEFEQDGDEYTSVELFTRLKPVLNEWPELLRDFAAFLHLEQAQECGLLAEQQAFERSRRFLRQLELSFGETSSRYYKIVSVLQGGPTLSPAGIKEMKAQMATLLQGHTHLQGEFWGFFNELHIRPSLQCQTENRGCGAVTNTNSTSQRSSAANAKRCQGPKTPKANRVREDEADEEKEGDRSNRPVCAKNISLTPSGEKVILWTREADRAILTACQQKGANKSTFQTVSTQLDNKTANEVCARFQDLMRLFRFSTQRVCSDEDASDTEQPTSSREPELD